MKRFIAIFAVLVLLPSFLSACSTRTYEEGYADGYDAGYRAAVAATTEPTSGGNTSTPFREWLNRQDGITSPCDPPASGTILTGKEYYGSEITVTAGSNDHYVVSLKDSSGTVRLAFFVKAGETVTVGVPAEYLHVYFASGDTWYGYGKGLMFGEDTVYAKDDTAQDFENYTWEYTLKPVYDGNFTEDPSNENEFFE